MPSAITIGSPEAQRQAPERQWVRNVGWTTVDVWIGNEAGIYGLVPALQAQYDNLDISTPDGVQYKIRASIASANDGAEEQPVNTWELLGSGLQENLTRHPNYAALAAGDREALDKFVSGETPPSSSPALTTAAGQSFFLLLRRDQNNYQDSQWVLRHTQLVSSRGQIAVSMSGINQLWTTSQILSANTVTPGIVTALGSIPNPPAVPQEHQYTWLKQTPTISQSLNSKTQIVEEWWLYFWPEILYADF